MPRQLCQLEGFSPEDLLAVEHRHQAHRALALVFERASEHLGKAFEYVLLIPAQQVQLRLFCLLPLWMALETLVIAVGNDAVLIADRPVKISRDAVKDIVEDCLRHANDDASLRRRYASSMSPKFKERLAKLAPLVTARGRRPWLGRGMLRSETNRASSPRSKRRTDSVQTVRTVGAVGALDAVPGASSHAQHA